MQQFIDKVPNREEAIELIKLTGSKVTELLHIANAVREKYCGNELHCCTISNAKSGKCTENCKFCAQSGYHNTGIETYEMRSTKDIIKEYENVEKAGSSHFGIVISGKNIKNGNIEFKTVKEFLEEIKSKNGIIPCGSLGNISYEDALELKNAGLKRYHNNLQVAPKRYKELVATTHTIEERIDSIKNAKRAGLEVCSGGILGMGETIEDRVDLAFALKELEVESIPVNILNPIKGTPLENSSKLNLDEILKAIAVFRLINKEKIIKVAAGREGILKDFMGSAFLAGANGMLVGGYLTVKGRSIEEDELFIQNIKRIWGN